MRCGLLRAANVCWRDTLGLIAERHSGKSRPHYFHECELSIFNRSCRPYNAKTLFSTTGTVITPITSHSEPLGNLIDGSYAYYALCQELSSSVLAGMCQINFNIGTSCVPGTVCANGLPCTIMGVCPVEPPVCFGAIPQTPPNLSAGTLTTTIGLTTSSAQTCKYDDSWATSYAAMTEFFDTTGGTTHTEPNAPSKDGSNAYYARCYDAALDRYAPVCSIPFDQGCSPTIGKVYSPGTTALAFLRTTDSRRVLRYAPAYPSGTQNVGAALSFGLNTTNNSTCKYADNNVLYESMTNCSPYQAG